MSTYTAKIRKKSGGDKLEVASGGVIDILAGGALKFAGTTMLPVAGVASGYKIARGEATLDGSNPTPIVTGLATVEACTATRKSATTPGDDPVAFTVDYGGGVTAGTVNLYAWKTDGTDPTLIASTNNSAVVSWIAIGT